jgi:hypothetical protein
VVLERLLRDEAREGAGDDGVFIVADALGLLALENVIIHQEWREKSLGREI